MNADLERSARAAPFVRPQLMIFQCNEMAAHDVPAPAGAAEFRPMIVIGRSAANINHAVDGACTAVGATLPPHLRRTIARRGDLIIPNMQNSRPPKPAQTPPTA